MRIRAIFLWFLWGCHVVNTGEGQVIEQVFSGSSDVSASVFVNDSHFVAADDETNLLRLYEVRNKRPLAAWDMSAFLQTDGKHPEADIEAAAQAGDRIYWITSHGRNKDGKERPGRRRFFCTRIEDSGEGPQLKPVGHPCMDLMQQFCDQPSIMAETISQAARFGEDPPKKERKSLAPKESGLNIEGLTWYEPHQSLLIGLRNPLFTTDGNHRDEAIVIELLNPPEVIEGTAARFGRVLLWNLDKRGIRGMLYSQRYKRYVILAGPVDDETTFALYGWDGDFAHQPAALVIWPKGDSFNSEAIAERPGEDGLWLFSDDGSLEIPVDSPADCAEGELLKNGNCPNKHLTDPARKTFRVRIIYPNKAT